MPLGIIFHNEAKIAEMCQILDALDCYVPAKKSTKVLTDEEANKEFEVDDTKVFIVRHTFVTDAILSQVFKMLVFRNQLRVARVCSASVIRSTTDHSILETCDGFTPAVADWDARACFLDVCKLKFMHVTEIT